MLTNIGFLKKGHLLSNWQQLSYLVAFKKRKKVKRKKNEQESSIRITKQNLMCSPPLTPPPPISLKTPLDPLQKFRPPSGPPFATPRKKNIPEEALLDNDDD